MRLKGGVEAARWAVGMKRVQRGCENSKIGNRSSSAHLGAVGEHRSHEGGEAAKQAVGVRLRVQGVERHD